MTMYVRRISFYNCDILFSHIHTLTPIILANLFKIMQTSLLWILLQSSWQYCCTKFVAILLHNLKVHVRNLWHYGKMISPILWQSYAVFYPKSKRDKYCFVILPLASSILFFFVKHFQINCKNLDKNLWKRLKITFNIF